MLLVTVRNIPKALFFIFPFVLILGCIITPLHFICFITALSVATVASPFFERGLLFRAASGFILLEIAAAVGLTFYSLVGIAITPESSALFYSIVSLMILGAGYRLKTLSLPKQPFPKIELLGLIVGLVLCVPLAYPFIHSGTPTDALSYIAVGGDNASHLELISSIWRNHEAVSSAAHSERSVTPNLVGYPVGWHLFVVSFGQLIKDNIVNTSKILALYEFMILFNIGMFFFLFISAITERYVRINKLSAIVIPIVLPFCLLLYFLIFGPSYLTGFATEIVTYPLIILLLIAARRYWASQKHDPYWLGLLLIINSGVSLFWLYLFPVTIVSTLLLVLFKLKYINKNLVKPTLKAYVLVGILLAPIVSYQAYIQAFKSAKGSDINAVGQIIGLNPYTVWLATIGCLFYLPFLVRKNQRSVHRVTLLFLAVATVFSVSVGVFQLATIGSWQYYFFKSLPVAVILICIAFCSFIIENMTNILTVIPRKFLVSSFLIGSSLMLVWPQASPIWKFYQGKLVGINPYVSQQIIGRMSMPVDMIVLGSCKRSQDYISTRFASILTGNNFPDKQYFYDAEVHGTRNMNKPLQGLITAEHGKQLTIVSVGKDLHLRKYVAGDTVLVTDLAQAQGSCSSDLTASGN